MLKHLFESVFLRNNVILLAGALAVGVLNYVFYLIIGRLLEPSAFGEVQAVVSLFLQLSMFLTVVNIVTVYIVANYRNKQRRNNVIFELEKVAVLLVGVVFVLSVLFGEQLREFFRFESAWPFGLLGLMLLITVPLTFRIAYLRGRNKFTVSTVANLLAAGGRFVFSIPLVLVSMGSVGAIAGVAISQAVALGYGAWQASKNGLNRHKDFRFFARPRISVLWPEIKYSLLVLVGTLAVTLLLTIDTLAVKHYFDAHTAGLYAGIATVSRMIFFLTASISQAMLPALKVEAVAGHNRGILIKSLIIFAALGLPTLGVFCLFPHQITTILMGSSYAEVAGLLPLLSVTIFTISLLNLLISYFLTLKRYTPGIFAIIGFAVALGLMLIHHASPQVIVESLFVGSMVSMCLIVVWVTRERLIRRSNDETTTTLHRGPSA